MSVCTVWGEKNTFPLLENEKCKPLCLSQIRQPLILLNVKTHQHPNITSYEAQRCVRHSSNILTAWRWLHKKAREAASRLVSSISTRYLLGPSLFSATSGWYTHWPPTWFFSYFNFSFFPISREIWLGWVKGTMTYHYFSCNWDDTLGHNCVLYLKERKKKNYLKENIF